MTQVPGVGAVVDLTDAGVAPPGRVGRLAAVWLAGWTAAVLGMAGVVSSQKHIPLRYTLASQAVNYYTLAVISLIVWVASKAISQRRWSLTRQVLVHVALGLLLVTAWEAIYGAYLRMAIGPTVWDSVYRGTWMFQVINAGVLYGGVLGGTLAIQATSRARAHERRQHELALLTRDAELRALNAQLEPHFLLNTLNSVMALMDAQPADARRMLERLCELFKAALEELQEHDVALGRELDLIEAYLGIEQVRFADRLRTTVDVPPDLREVRVPPFLLQPIVENAIKHGIAPFSGPGSIAIRARRDGTATRIDISDSGPGFVRHEDHAGREHHEPAAGAHGLSLAERRLRAFAPGGGLRAERGADGRFTISLRIPA
jgi:hypothetical protein